MMTELPKFLRGRRPEQVAILVEDLATAIATWSQFGGLDDWKIYSYHRGNTQGLSYRGTAGEFEVRLAFAGSEPQIELVQSITGPSIYSEWIESRGYGMHHLGYFVDSIAAAIVELRSEGHEPVQSAFGYGLDGDGGFAYYELPGLSDVVVELIERPRRRRPPESLQ
jgi:methylmalonyl-CoA/ethylmalonyl-CoA epimerase